MAIRKVKTKSGVRYKAEVYDPDLGRAASVASYRSDGVGTFRTKREAEDALTDARRTIELRRGSAALTVTELHTKWLADVRGKRKPSTVAYYETCTAPLVAAYPDMAIDAFGDERAARWHEQRPQHYSVAASAMFGWAVKKRYLQVNPFRGLERDLKTRKLEPGFLTMERVNRLVEVADELGGISGRMMGTAITVAAWTCIRPGELFALRMSDLDLDEDPELADLPPEWRFGSMRIERAVSLDRKGVVHVGLPKSGQAREVLLPPAARDRILSTRPLVEALGGGDLVICLTTGKQMSRDMLRHTWVKVVKAADCPGLQFYDLRHFGATYLAEMGVAEDDIVAQLGHGDAKVYRRHYKHDDPRVTHRRMRRQLYAASLAPVPLDLGGMVDGSATAPDLKEAA